MSGFYNAWLCFQVKVIVFHYTEKGKLPKLTDQDLNNLKAQLSEELKNYPGVTYNGTFVDQDGRGICDWDAPNKEVVAEILEKVLGEKPIDGLALVHQIL